MVNIFFLLIFYTLFRVVHHKQQRRRGCMRLVEAVGKRVDDLLTERNMKQNHLAKQGGISRSTISVLIASKRNAVELDTVYQICATLGITLKDFFDDPLFDEVTD